MALRAGYWAACLLFGLTLPYYIIRRGYFRSLNATTAIRARGATGGAAALRSTSLMSPVNGALPAGSRPLVWDGHAEQGSPVSSGIYFVRATCPGGRQVVRIPLVR